MVVGLERFAAHFHDQTDKYVLIGGVATQLALDAGGVAFRPTKDLDIVLLAEALDSDFVGTFWEFIRLGGYAEHTTAATEGSSPPRRVLHRFAKPSAPGFPAMLELFSRAPPGVDPTGRLTAIAVDDDLSSLSAILLDEVYYSLLTDLRVIRHGVAVVREEGLILLKAKAWLDLSGRRERGETVDSRVIRKHATDILRLAQLLTPNTRHSTSPAIQTDLSLFLTAVPSSLQAVEHMDGIGRIDVAKTLLLLREVFGL